MGCEKDRERERERDLYSIYSCLCNNMNDIVDIFTSFALCIIWIMKITTQDMHSHMMHLSFEVG